MCLTNVRHRTNLIPSQNFVITQISQVWIDVVSTYLESRETKDSPNPWYPFLKYLTCSSRQSSNLQNHQKITTKEKRKKRSKPNGNLCSHILETLNYPMKKRRPQSLRDWKKLQHGGVIGGNSEGGQEDRHIMLQFFLLPLRLRSWRGSSRRHSQKYFATLNLQISQLYVNKSTTGDAVDSLNLLSKLVTSLGLAHSFIHQACENPSLLFFLCERLHLEG